jgi:hypothetical protein
MEYEDVKQWGIRLDNGAVLVMAYWPESGYRDKGISFIARGEGGELTPSEELD